MQLGCFQNRLCSVGRKPDNLQGSIFPELRNQVIPPGDKIIDHENTE